MNTCSDSFTSRNLIQVGSDTRAGSVEAARSANQQAGGGANPTPALHNLKLVSIPHVVAKRYVERHHYLHSMPGGTELCFGVISHERLAGAITFGAGPANAFRMVLDAERDDGLTLSRVCFDDDLPKNSESRLLGLALRWLKRMTLVKFVVSYADPAQGHLGTIYQAGNWLYTGLSDTTPLYDLGDGNAVHSRTLSHEMGTHSVEYLKERGVSITKVPQQAKHRYIYLLDGSLRDRLNVPVLPYPKREGGAL